MKLTEIRIENENPRVRRGRPALIQDRATMIIDMGDERFFSYDGVTIKEFEDYVEAIRICDNDILAGANYDIRMDDLQLQLNGIRSFYHPELYRDTGKEALVKELGKLLSMTREGITCARYERGTFEWAILTFRDGAERRINVTCDSNLAIIKDVIRALED